MWLQVMSSSKTHELARLVVCSKLFGPLVLYELQRRAIERGHIHDKPVPHGFGTKLAHLVWLEWLHEAETPFYPLMQQDAKNDAWQALSELTPRELEQYTGVIAFELVSRFRNNQLMLSEEQILRRLIDKLNPVAIAHIAGVVVEYIDDASWWVSGFVLDIIGKLGPIEFENYIDRVISKLDSDGVRIDALRVLGQYPAVIARHFDIVEEKYPSAAMDAMSKFDPVEREKLADFFLHKLSSKDLNIREWAFSCVCNFAPAVLEENAHSVGMLLRDEDPSVRDIAFYILRRLERYMR
jgi:hypothetical protein